MLSVFVDLKSVTESYCDFIKWKKELCAASSRVPPELLLPHFQSFSLHDSSSDCSKAVGLVHFCLFLKIYQLTLKIVKSKMQSGNFFGSLQCKKVKDQTEKTRRKETKKCEIKSPLDETMWLHLPHEAANSAKVLEFCWMSSGSSCFAWLSTRRQAAGASGSLPLESKFQHHQHRDHNSLRLSAFTAAENEKWKWNLPKQSQVTFVVFFFNSSPF